MSPEERALVDGARKRANAATKGPWYQGETDENSDGDADCAYYPNWEWIGGPLEKEEDAAFIAHARTDVPALCDLADRQEAELAAKDARIAELEAELARSSR